LNLTGFSGKITFSEIPERKKRKADADSDCDSSLRCEELRSPDQLSTVKKKRDTRDGSPPSVRQTINPRSKELVEIFAAVQHSPGGSVTLSYSDDNEKGVFSFLGGKTALQSGAVEVMCSNYDPTKKKTEDLVCAFVQSLCTSRTQLTSTLPDSWEEGWSGCLGNRSRRRRRHFHRVRPCGGAGTGSVELPSAQRLEVCPWLLPPAPRMRFADHPPS
jgi:hypothetical protein